MFDSKILFFVLVFIGTIDLVFVFRFGQSGLFDILQIIDVVEFVRENVIELRMFYYVVGLLEPLLPLPLITSI